jgi:hypothetical protein
MILGEKLEKKTMVYVRGEFKISALESKKLGGEKERICIKFSLCHHLFYLLFPIIIFGYRYNRSVTPAFYVIAHARNSIRIHLFSLVFLISFR